MSDLLKDMFNHKSLSEFAASVQSVYPPFQVDEFLKLTIDETWESLELKARGRKITTTLGKFLSADYREALSILEKAAKGFSFAYFFPDFIEVYGQDNSDWDVSIGALERNTEYWSSELAVRPFIIKYETRMMAQMADWSKHENEHVRRLASEGCRPALPWGQALTKYKKDPAPILPILEQLKTDPSPYVRKSVANNLNDISKTHPDLIAKLAKEWYGKNEDTNWIVKHGCRTLLKKGRRDVLALFGYHDETPIAVSDFALRQPAVSLGENITFLFSVQAKETSKVRLEYGVDYVKASGKRNRKIFQISAVTLKENEQKSYTRKHAMADLSTRKHYPGPHSITLIVNGIERGTLHFELKA